MPLTASTRKLALTAHTTSSVGWLGAVAAFLALAVAGLTSRDGELVRAAYLAMELVGWWVIVPLSLASLPTGVVLSLGTEWGLFRHRWVLAKIVIAVPATLLLLLHMQPVGHLARSVAETTLAHGALAGLRLQMVANAGAALVVLLVATALSIYKPRGLTAYGRRRSQRRDDGQDGQGSAAGMTRGTLVLSILAVIALLLFVILHIARGGVGGH